MQAPDQGQAAHDTVPQNLHRLDELARNLWWSWTPTARQLFESIDPTLWLLTTTIPFSYFLVSNQNGSPPWPGDPSFVRRYSAVLRTFDEYLSDKKTWAATEFPRFKILPIAYFSRNSDLHI